MTFDELLALDSQGKLTSGGPHGYYGKGFGPMFGKRNNSAWALAGNIDNPEEMWCRQNRQSMRKVKSAENLSNPRIIVNR